MIFCSANAAALSGGAVCWDAKRHVQSVTSRSSALFGVFYSNDALFSSLLLFFKDNSILFLFGADQRRAERQGSAARSAGTIYFLVPAECPVSQGAMVYKRSCANRCWLLFYLQEFLSTLIVIICFLSLPLYL
jgi:hypothetical protein